MQKLLLEYTKIINGNFELKPLNFLLVFQVNCPGCFLYALPFFNDLFQQYASENIGFLALSTAFEDFELNTESNTQALIDKGLLVGETKKALHQHGVNELPFTIDFPIGIDQQAKEPSQFKAMAIHIAKLNPNFDIWPEFDQKAMEKRIMAFLEKQHQVPVTFTSNQFRGTPTFVLFNDKNEILENWFGHLNKETLKSALSHHQEIIKKYSKQ